MGEKQKMNRKDKARGFLWKIHRLLSVSTLFWQLSIMLIVLCNTVFIGWCVATIGDNFDLDTFFVWEFYTRTIRGLILFMVFALVGQIFYNMFKKV